MKKIIFVIILLKSICFSSEVKQETKNPDMENLLSLKGYVPRWDTIRDHSEDGSPLPKEESYFITSGAVSIIDEKFCTDKCLDNFNKLSEKMKKKNIVTDVIGGWNTKLQGLLSVEVYENSKFEEPVGSFISNSPYLLRVGDEFYTNEEWDHDYRDYYADLSPAPRLKVPQREVHGLTFVGGKNYQAIWVHQLKKFFYIRNNSNFIRMEEVYDDFRNPTPCTSKIYYSFLDTAILYDENNNKITRENLVGLIPIGFESKSDYISFHFYDSRNREVKTNKLPLEGSDETIMINAWYLLDYYGYDQPIIYKMYKKDVLNDQGKVNVYMIGSNLDEVLATVTCPYDKMSDEFKTKLKNGEIKWNDLPDDYRSSSYTENIFFTYITRPLLFVRGDNKD